MKLYLDFEPCDECVGILNNLTNSQLLTADEETRESESVKFLRHLTYNHPEVVQAVLTDIPKQKKRQEYDFFR
jgi:hypothetical protein